MSSSIKNLTFSVFSRIIDKLNNFQHLQDKKITYFQHLQQSIELAKKTLLATIIFIIHGIYPDILVESGSKILKDNLNKISSESQK
jgi:hypothetical protein